MDAVEARNFANLISRMMIVEEELASLKEQVATMDFGVLRPQIRETNQAYQDIHSRLDALIDSLRAAQSLEARAEEAHNTLVTAFDGLQSEVLSRVDRVIGVVNEMDQRVDSLTRRVQALEDEKSGFVAQTVDGKMNIQRQEMSGMRNEIADVRQRVDLLLEDWHRYQTQLRNGA